jgi:signal peptidase I
MVYNLVYFVFSIFNKGLGFLGVSFFNVNSASMEPELTKNDLTIVKKVKLEELQANDIIIYQKAEEYRITRIMNVHNNRNTLSFVIKGDNLYYPEEILGESVKRKSSKRNLKRRNLYKYLTFQNLNNINNCIYSIICKIQKEIRNQK